MPIFIDGEEIEYATQELHKIIKSEKINEIMKIK